MLNIIKPINMIIDTDMGWDDVLSILYLMKNPKVNIMGITVTGCGETHLQEGVKIAQALLKMGNIDAPVSAGAAYPSQYNHHFPESFRKMMDDVCGLKDQLPEVTEPADSRTAWELMRGLLNDEENQIVILSLGGLTNIARLLEMNPKPKLENIEQIVIMGGAVNADGNVAALNNSKPEWNQGSVYATNHYAEWNIFLDPQPAKDVIHSGIPTTLVPLDACDYILLQQKYANCITADDPVAHLAKQLIEQKTVGPAKEPLPLPIFDPLASMIAADDLRHIRMPKLRIDINTVDTDYDNTCGLTYIVRDESVHPIHVVLGASELEFQEVFSNIMNAPLQPKGDNVHKNVGILLFDEVEAQDFAGAFEVFAAARNADDSAVFDVFTIAKEKKPLRSNAGVPVENGTQSHFMITPDYSFAKHPHIDVLVVIGGQGIDGVVKEQDEDPMMINWIQEVSKTATYVAGICSGVLLLTRAGVLTNLKVSTHHTRFNQLQQMSDEMKLGLEVLDTRNGKNFIHEPYSKFMTSGGVHCGIALATHIIGLYLGEEVKDQLAYDVLEYTIPRGLVKTPEGFPGSRHVDPRDLVLGFSHINVIVADLDMMEEATEFYSRVLGFEQAWSLWLPDEVNKHFAHDAGYDECKVMVRFLVHPNAQIHLELMMYEYPKGDQEVHYHKTNDVGGIRHVALEVADAVAAYEWLKDQEGVQIIKPVREGYGNPEKLTPDDQTFFYWLDPYGVQWEFEQGRPMARVINGIIG